MDAELTLTCEAGALVIGAGTRTPGGDRWCPVYLVMGGVRRPLGAQALSYLREHLLAFLNAPAEELDWVFSLNELHTRGYGEHRQGNFNLRLQDRNAVFFATLVLSAADRETWRQRLAAFQPSEGGPQA